MSDRNHIRFDDLAKNRPYAFALGMDDLDVADMQAILGVRSIAKVRFEGDLVPLGKRGWRLNATLGATVVQNCVISGDPVTIRIDTDVERLFSPTAFEEFEAGSEYEMPEDADSIDPQPEILILSDVIAEALTLELPDYPRAKNAQLGTSVFAAEDVTPMTDEAVRPFAGLAGLRDSLGDADNS
ncbi:MAG: YceD family protein [Planktomarina sp.]